MQMDVLAAVTCQDAGRQKLVFAIRCAHPQQEASVIHVFLEMFRVLFADAACEQSPDTRPGTACNCRGRNGSKDRPARDGNGDTANYSREICRCCDDASLDVADRLVLNVFRPRHIGIVFKFGR
jgi:hypothetical protein